MNNIELQQIVKSSKATTEDFADELEVSRSTLNRWMNGSTPIRNNVLLAIEQVAENFKKNPPKYRLHQMAPRRRRMK